MNFLLNKSAPFKKISKYKLKVKTKPWITFRIQNKSVLLKIKKKIQKPPPYITEGK